MRNTAHLHRLIGLALLFTLMTGAGAFAQAVGVVFSHVGSALTLTTAQHHPEASEHPAGTVATPRSCVMPQHLRPLFTRSLPGRVAPFFSLLTASSHGFPARMIPAVQRKLLLYALHPRPPTAPHFA